MSSENKSYNVNINSNRKRNDNNNDDDVTQHKVQHICKNAKAQSTG